MSSNHHTPLLFGGPLSQAAMESPLSELDAAIDLVQSAVASTMLAITLTSGVAAAAQKVVPVSSTNGFLVGQPVFIGDVGGTFEVGIIASIQAGVSLTMVANLVNTYAAGKVVSASPSEVVAARQGSATLDARLDAIDALIASLAPDGMRTTAGGANSLNTTSGTFVFPAWGTLIDPHGGFTTTPNTRWVCQSGHAGFYDVTVGCFAFGTTAGQAAGNIRIFELLKNGVKQTSCFCVMASATTGTESSMAAQIPLAVGDYIEVRAKAYTTNGDLQLGSIAIIRKPGSSISLI